MRAVNLLPPDLRGALAAPASVAAGERAGGAGPYVVLAVLALCVVALAGYVLTTNGIKQREADLAELDTRSVTVMAESARLKPYADFQSTAQARIATVRDLATRRFDWEQAFRDLARALPRDVTVKTLGASASSQVGAGGTSSTLRAALDVPAIQIDGCTSDQRAVARMMARLRGVRGATRVSLDNSIKPPRTGAAIVAAGGPASGCAAKGDSTPPDFTVVVFFERAAAAAAGASGGAATGAGPAAGSGSTGDTATPQAGGSGAGSSAATAPSATITTDGAE